MPVERSAPSFRNPEPGPPAQNPAGGRFGGVFLSALFFFAPIAKPFGDGAAAGAAV